MHMRGACRTSCEAGPGPATATASAASSAGLQLRKVGRVVESRPLRSVATHPPPPQGDDHCAVLCQRSAFATRRGSGTHRRRRGGARSAPLRRGLLEGGPEVVLFSREGEEIFSGTCGGRSDEGKRSISAVERATEYSKCPHSRRHQAVPGIGWRSQTKQGGTGRLQLARLRE